MSHHDIHDPRPSIYWKHYDSTLQFHLKATNGPNSSYGKEEQNSILREKLLWRNYLLHIESASLCPLSLNNSVQPPSSSIIDGEPFCILYMSLPLVED